MYIYIYFIGLLCKVSQQQENHLSKEAGPKAHRVNSVLSSHSSFSCVCPRTDYCLSHSAFSSGNTTVQSTASSMSCSTSISALLLPCHSAPLSASSCVPSRARLGTGRSHYATASITFFACASPSLSSFITSPTARGVGMTNYGASSDAQLYTENQIDQ